MVKRVKKPARLLLACARVKKEVLHLMMMEEEVVASPSLSVVGWLSDVCHCGECRRYYGSSSPGPLTTEERKGKRECTCEQYLE